MRPPHINYGWNPIETAPLDEDIALPVTDGRGKPYTLQWPCRLTASPRIVEVSLHQTGLAGSF
jgi:hypothetical protein